MKKEIKNTHDDADLTAEDMEYIAKAFLNVMKN